MIGVESNIHPCWMLSRSWVSHLRVVIDNNRFLSDSSWSIHSLLNQLNNILILISALLQELYHELIASLNISQMVLTELIILFQSVVNLSYLSILLSQNIDLSMFGFLSFIESFQCVLAILDVSFSVSVSLFLIESDLFIYFLKFIL